MLDLQPNHLAAPLDRQHAARCAWYTWALALVERGVGLAARQVDQPRRSFIRPQLSIVHMRGAEAQVERKRVAVGEPDPRVLGLLQPVAQPRARSRHVRII